ncbi:hypothetical protein KKF61_08680 [Patescibacteria group bacterium]|nr:hypothetical protein [Patescibacteria group bacterium]
MTKKKYYKTKIDALKSRNKGDRIYYDANEEAYYIVAPVKRQFWRI